MSIGEGGHSLLELPVCMLSCVSRGGRPGDGLALGGPREYRRVDLDTGGMDGLIAESAGDCSETGVRSSTTTAPAPEAERCLE